VSWKFDTSDKIRFWLDDWLDGQNLAWLLPRFFLISDQKEEVVGNMGTWRKDTG